jgi:hypothetical protein
MELNEKGNSPRHNLAGFLVRHPALTDGWRTSQSKVKKFVLTPILVFATFDHLHQIFYSKQNVFNSDTIFANYIYFQLHLPIGNLLYSELVFGYAKCSHTCH